MPGFIVIGTTTRADVLLALGDPDQRADSDRRFLYVRESLEGGVAFAVGGVAGGSVVGGGPTGTPVTFRVLAVSFDDRGVATVAIARRVVKRDFGPYLSDPVFKGDFEAAIRASP